MAHFVQVSICVALGSSWITVPTVPAPSTRATYNGSASLVATPISWLVHSPLTEPVVETLVNTASQIAPALWLVTARPIKILEPIWILVELALLTGVQLEPSGEWETVKRPEISRSSFTQCGAVIPL